ncbi:MAG TPA: cupin domain-containing protein [Hyphomicrobiaceae bacterium]|nr:cupin domain-containing protein [Hyphomicrobiaceae bacterium]
MVRWVGLLATGAVLAGMAFSPASAQQLDPKVVGYRLPDQITWVDNTRSGNRTAVLQGDPSKPGPYAMLLQWLPGNMSRPHFHPHDRFFMVLSGTWWVGSGPDFNPEATVAMPAGSHVIHYAKGVHFDGAKSEPATILVWGEGPATSTPFAPPASAK